MKCDGVSRWVCVLTDAPAGQTGNEDGRKCGLCRWRIHWDRVPMPTRRRAPLAHEEEGGRRGWCCCSHSRGLWGVVGADSCALSADVNGCNKAKRAAECPRLADKKMRVKKMNNTSRAKQELFSHLPPSQYSVWQREYRTSEPRDTDASHVAPWRLCTQWRHGEKSGLLETNPGH